MKLKHLNHLIIWKELSLFIGTNERVISKHQHPFIQLIAGVNGPYLWKDDGGNWSEKNILLVSPNHPHECDANGQKVIIITIDNESRLGEFLRDRYFKSKPIIDFSPNNEKFDLTLFIRLLAENQWEDLHQRIMSSLDFNSMMSVQDKKDNRIQNVLDYINDNINNEINTKSLMDVSYLSESRLLHLFKEQIGLPIRNYILWYRIQIAFNEIVKGMSLTQAAHFAGFSDQAHLTRTFVRTFGAPPSTLLKNSKFVQVSFPS